MKLPIILLVAVLAIAASGLALPSAMPSPTQGTSEDKLLTDMSNEYKRSGVEKNSLYTRILTESEFNTYVAGRAKLQKDWGLPEPVTSKIDIFSIADIARGMRECMFWTGGAYGGHMGVEKAEALAKKYAARIVGEVRPMEVLRIAGSIDPVKEWSSPCMIVFKTSDARYIIGQSLTIY
ncbi:hypothetical protein HK102_004879 [Quaeritorhiza haematococci]|nr:hypothetical protein HK102_004879 [Quaeritorhiza haematococci]